MQCLLIAADIAAVVIAVAVSLSLGVWVGVGSVWPKAAALSAIVVFTLYLADLYRVDLQPSSRELVARLLVALAAIGILAAAVSFAVPALRFGRLAFVEILGFVAGGLALWRAVWARLNANKRFRPRVLVLGVSRAADSIVRLQTTGAQPFTLLGFLDDAPGASMRLQSETLLLGKTKDLLNLVDELQPDLVLVALPNMRGAFPADELLACRLRGIRVEDWPTFYEKQTGRILVTGLRPSWLIFSDGFVKTNLTRTVKRLTDVVLAGSGLVVSLPVMGLAALAIKLDSKGPVMFRQARVGENGRTFVLFKFRSMCDGAERGSGPVWASPGDPRITRVGQVLRRARLDELPQLLNVLRGDMSFVGPRPERPEFVSVLCRQIPFYMERHSVRPGLTGWAQVSHHYAGSVEDSVEKLQYDLYYIKNLSPFLDLLILLHTVQVVLFGRGAR